MGTLLRVLIIEDVEGDVLLILRALKKAGYDVTNKQVDTAEQMRDALSRQQWDIIISDYAMPRFNGRGALELLLDTGLDIPFIVVSGTMGEETAVDMMKAGAHDYIMKNNMARLIPSVERELAQAAIRRERRLMQEKVQESEKYYRTLVNTSPEAIIIIDRDGLISFASPKSFEMFGLSPDRQVIGQPLLNWVEPDDHAKVMERFREVISGKFQTGIREYKLVRDDGTSFWGEIASSPLMDAHESFFGLLIICRDITERKLAEVKLRESEQHYRNLFDANPQPMWVYDLRTFQFLAVNDTAVRKYGYTREEFLSMSVKDIRPDEEVKRWEQYIIKNTPELVHTGIWKHRLHNGTVIFVEIVSHPFNFEGVPARLVLANDITERIKVEQALRESEERLRLSMMAGKQGWYDTNIQTGESIVNDEYALMLGYDPAAFVETHRFWIERLHPDDRERAVNAYNEYISGRSKEYFIEFRQRAGDGQWKWILSLGKITEFDWDGKPLRMMGTHTDITEIKRVEESLIQSELMFRSVWDHTGSGMRLADENGLVINVNNAYCRMVEKERDEIIGQNLAIIFAEKDRQRVIEKHIKNFQMRNVPSYHEKNLLLWNGKNVWFEVANSFIDIQGSRHLLLGIFTDVTEKKKLESQFMRAQRLDSLGTLAGGIAHDLNNVLAPILLSIEILKRSFVDDNTHKILTAVESSARRGADIVKQILSFTRGLETKKSAIQSRHLIDELITVFRETFPRSISIVNTTPKNLWAISGDPTHFHQVILNLSVNARDAMPEGGTLTISAENKKIDEQYARMNIQAQPGRYVVYSISDTGTGMSPEIMDKIFDPFFTTKEVGKGTGLGLSTVHSIVKNHGGFIETRSEVGKGTTFNVYFPAADVSSETSAEKESGDILDGTGELVLVVDDEQSVREVTKQTLEAFHYTVLTASEGTEAAALYSVQSSAISLVITDMMMPVMDGAKLVQTLRRINPSLKIIGSSGLIDKRDGASKELGLNDFLLKPYTAEDLLICVKNVLMKK